MEVQGWEGVCERQTDRQKRKNDTERKKAKKNASPEQDLASSEQDLACVDVDTFMLPIVCRAWINLVSCVIRIRPF